jgi:transposase
MPATARDSLIRSRSRLLNAVRGIAASEDVRLSKCAPDKLVDLVASHRDAYPAGMYEAMQPMLDAIEALSISIDVGTEELETRANKDPVLVRLRIVPGVGPVTASLYAAAIIDPHRFSSARQVGAYLGLVPRVYQSGGTHRRGQITKRGNRQVRWALTMSANAVLLTRRSCPLVDWGKRMEQRLGRKKACVAIARKLAAVLWAVWLHELDYRGSAAA